MKKAIVLLSGGIDSATTLYYAKARGYRCECLTFDYGQKNKREVSSARRIAATCGLRLTVVKFRLRWGGSSLLRGNLGIPRGTKPKRGKIPSTYVPGRNTIFLSFALSYAEAHKAGAIFIGAHTQDYSGYPDCRSRYFKAFGKMVHLGTKAGITGKKIKIITPLLYKNKSQIIKMGLKLKVPYRYTWSCYRGGRRPCGSCDSCLFRARGFKKVGMRDPIYAKR